MIQCRCPSCGTVITASAAQGGSKIACPACGQRLLIPPPSRDKTALAPRVENDDEPGTRLGVPEPTEAGRPQRTHPGPPPPAVPSLEPYRAPPTVVSTPPRAEARAGEADDPRPPRSTGRHDRDEERDRRRARDDEDDDRPRRRGGRYDYQPCPRCGCTDRPYQTKRLGPAGIALLIAGIIFWPLLIVCIFMQETWETCPACGERIRQIGTGP